MKKIPEKFINKIRETMEQSCDVNCEECIFHENGLCDNFSNIVQAMECAIDKNNKLMQIKQ